MHVHFDNVKVELPGTTWIERLAPTFLLDTFG